MCMRMQENFLRTLERIFFFFLAPGLTDHWPCDYERKVCWYHTTLDARPAHFRWLRPCKLWRSIALPAWAPLLACCHAYLSCSLDLAAAHST